MSFLDKAKEVIHDNIEKVEGAIDKAGDFVDEKTSGKFADVVDKVQDGAKNLADKATDAAGAVKDKAADAAGAAKDAASDAADKVTGQ